MEKDTTKTTVEDENPADPDAKVTIVDDESAEASKTTAKSADIEITKSGKEEIVTGEVVSKK